MRKKNGIRKFMGLCLGLSVITAFFAGCGTSNPTGDPNEIVYVSETLDLDFGNRTFLHMQEGSDQLYMILSEDVESSAVPDQFWKIDIVTGARKEIPLFAQKENETITGFVLNESDQFTFLTTRFDGSVNNYSLYEVSSGGEVVEEKDITEIAGDIAYIKSITNDKQGNLYLAADNGMGGGQILVLDPSGGVKDRMDYPEFIGSLYCTGDGEVYISSWGSLKKADIAGKTVGEAITLNGVGARGSLFLAPGGPTGTLVCDSYGVFSCDLETGQCVKIIDWLESDIDGNGIRQFGVTEKGVYWAGSLIWMNDAQSNAQVAVINQTTADKVPAKEVLTFGVLFMNPDVSHAVVNFNKTNKDYRIQVKEYMGGDWANWENGRIQLAADLSGANCPDVIDMSAIDSDMAISNGILADLYPHMDKDNTFQKSDYMENILSVYEKDSKLHGIMVSYTTYGLVGNAGLLQGMEGWDLDEMLAFAEKHPDTRLFNGTWDEVLYTLLCTNIEKYVNFSTGESFFDQEEFIRIMEYVKTYSDVPDRFDPDRLGNYESIRAGKNLLQDMSFYDVTALQLMEVMFNGPVNVVGYPVAEGSGIALQPSFSVGMSAKSETKTKDGVWEFMKFLLSEDIQGGLNATPVKKSAIDALCKKAMEITGPINKNYEDLSTDIYAPTETEVTQYKELLNRADRLITYNSEMQIIISEELESYISGQKTAEEAAEIIQNRVQIYVQENK